ncbi:hypothetical protein BO94DRAFT_549189 [Aspergillus sclerotioniger CBS 115572]|uniref:Uncharacterized protein n=1 Tax=Aspergillus sclerotioniger CBS 115572 TaxID=1450535 RepID=A0A317VTX2_9EURO|nr:hypothetical protein BO94DRAFT_549189 [Aspergillus sclerotioniger CBS 115572]PWY76402.1 hypothetical protein BO94DRAFT_549189 [Aspergillus sclerotioniger CBS 115572]
MANAHALPPVTPLELHGRGLLLTRQSPARRGRADEEKDEKEPGASGESTVFGTDNGKQHDRDKYKSNRTHGYIRMIPCKSVWKRPDREKIEKKRREKGGKETATGRYRMNSLTDGLIGPAHAFHKGAYSNI